MKKFYLNGFKFIVFIFLFLIDISIGESPKNEISFGKSKGKGCKRLLSEFKESNLLFVTCSLEHAVPVKFCTNCSADYFNVLDSFNVLITSNDSANENHTLRCRDFYLDQDRLNIVNSFYNNAINLWNNANCDDCYSNRTLKNQTINFFSKNSNLTDCIEKEGNNTNDVCAGCDYYYTDLNKYFNYDIKENDNDKVCFDIQDQMNRTRSLWSKTLKCCQRPVNLTGFGLVSSVFACIPILFYSGMYFYTKRQEANESELLTDNPNFTENNSRLTTDSAINDSNINRNTNEIASEIAEPSTSSSNNNTRKPNTSSKNNNLTKKRQANEFKIDEGDDDVPPLIFEPNVRSNISPIVISGSSRGNKFEKDGPELKASSYEDNNFLFDNKVSANKDIKIPAEIHTEPKLINLDQ